MSNLMLAGQELAKFADTTAEFTAQRGVVETLFPFIWQASHRMSLRAVSKWLWEAKRIKLSANTLARAMRNQDKYWGGWYESIAPHAAWLAEFYGTTREDVLEKDHEDFEEFMNQGIPKNRWTGKPDMMPVMERREAALLAIASGWLPCPADARKKCLARAAALGIDGKRAAKPGKGKGMEQA
jgi:hypothetical protein